MPKPYSFPVIFDSALQLHIKKLKKWGYLKTGAIGNTVVTWSENGNKIGSITIKVNLAISSPYIELDYKYKDESRNYRVNLVAKPSNLGKGLIWYFLCPLTKRLCRKLYSIEGYFLHREAIKGCMYESQTHSKKWRKIEKVYGDYFDQEKYYKELNSKHFRKYYNGKPTKRYLYLMDKINNIENIDKREIELLFLI